jgi:hypothetical protein
MGANPVHVSAVKAVNEVEGMKPDDAREYLEMLGCAAIHFMRAKFGDEYVRGWLQHAMSDLDHPPMLVARKKQ